MAIMDSYELIQYGKFISRKGFGKLQPEDLNK